MAENKKSFILYADQREIFNQLPDDIAGKLIKHIFSYISDENPPCEDFILNLAFTPIKLQLKRDLENWDATKSERSESGILGNLKRWHTDLYEKVCSGQLGLKAASSIAKDRTAIGSDTERSLSIANIAVNVNDTVTVNDTVIKENTLTPVGEEKVDKPINIPFETFWNLYDKKVGDKEKLTKKWNRLTDKEREQAIKHIPLYKISKPDKVYRKDPQTYLNNKSFNDEIITDAINKSIPADYARPGTALSPV